MMEYPEIDKYASLDSPMHRFDPRAKIIAFVFLTFSIVLLNDLTLVLIGFLVSILFLIASKLPFHFVIRHLKGVSLFIIPFLVIMPFTVKGDHFPDDCDHEVRNDAKSTGYVKGTEYSRPDAYVYVSLHLCFRE